MFGDQCCNVIPNNTAPEGAFTEVMTKLKTQGLNLKPNAKTDSKIWDWFDLNLRAWGAWLAKLVVAVLIGGLLFYCVFSIPRSLLSKPQLNKWKMQCQD